MDLLMGPEDPPVDMLQLGEFDASVLKEISKRTRNVICAIKKRAVLLLRREEEEEI